MSAEASGAAVGLGALHGETFSDMNYLLLVGITSSLPRSHLAFAACSSISSISARVAREASLERARCEQMVDGWVVGGGWWVMGVGWWLVVGVE